MIPQAKFNQQQVDEASSFKIDSTQLLELAGAITEAVSSRFDHQPSHTSRLTGNDYLEELLQEETNPRRFQEIMRMSKPVFLKLCEWLAANGGLYDGPEVTVKEQVAMFLWTVTRGASNSDVKERFQHSGQTVSRYVS